MLLIVPPVLLMFLMEPKIVLNVQALLLYSISVKPNVLHAQNSTSLTQPPIPVELTSPVQKVSSSMKQPKNANVTQATHSLTEQHASLAISLISGILIP